MHPSNLINNINQATVGIIGQKGTGKTVLTKLLTYHYVEEKKLVIVLDSLQVFKNNDYIPIFKINPTDNPVQVKEVFNECIKKKQSIILSFNQMVNEEVVEFTDILFTNINIKDAVIVVDEIQEFCPQFGDTSKELTRFIRTCRNKNNGIIFNTQRPAQVSKNIIALIDEFFIFKIIWKADLDTMNSVLYRLSGSKENADYLTKLIPKLRKLNCIKV
jgi:archaellum biogenesis ATPase FlaH